MTGITVLQRGPPHRPGCFALPPEAVMHAIEKKKKTEPCDQDVSLETYKRRGAAKETDANAHFGGGFWGAPT